MHINPAVTQNNASVTNAIRILLVDDHQLLLDAIKRPLQQVGFEIFTSNSFSATCEQINENGFFDVVLLDVNMPDMNGLTSIKTIINLNEPGATVLFSGSASTILVSRALEEGAKGYIPKSLPLSTLENALRLVASGERFVPYCFIEAANRDYAGQMPPKPGAKLSARELRVLYGASVGQSNKEIAHELALSEVTIKMHMRSICCKLGAKNRTQAAMIAKQLQII